jgi:hypothetical protein
MRASIVTILVIFSVLEWSTSMAQSGPLTVIAEFPGSSLKWVRIAEPEFEREKLDLNNYTISIIDEGDSVTVILKTPGLSEKVRGNGGKYPGYWVEISKKDSKVVRAAYTR